MLLNYKMWVLGLRRGLEEGWGCFEVTDTPTPHHGQRGTRAVAFGPMPSGPMPS